MERVSLPTGLPVGEVHVYVERSADGVVLVDTGVDTPEGRRALDEALGGLGLRTSDIAQVWITHPHVDHMGLAGWIQKASGATVHGSPETCRWLQAWDEVWAERIGWAKAFLGLSGCPQSMVRVAVGGLLALKGLGAGAQAVTPCDDGSRLGDFTAVRTDGHARGHLAFVSKDTVLVGDHLIRHVSSNPVVEPPDGQGLWPSMASVQIESLHRSLAWRGIRALSGHGRLIEDAGALASERLGEIDRRTEAVLCRVDGRRTLFEIATDLFPALKPAGVFLAASEVGAHIFRLRDQGRVVLEEAGGAWRPLVSADRAEGRPSHG